jgi:hypothetical protein
VVWAALGFLVWLLVLLASEASLRLLRAGSVPPPAPDEGVTPISVIVAAHDEAPRIAVLLESLLAQDHPDFEVRVVDDRSTDGTGEAAARFAARDPRVAVERVDEIEAGWHGRLFAQQRGAQGARGPWLLFLSADQILASRDFLRGMVATYERKGLDGVSVIGPFVGEGWWQRGWFQPMLNHPLFWGVLLASQRLDPDSVWLIGAPAMRRDTYGKLGGTAAAARAAGLNDDKGWSRVFGEHGLHGELVYHRALLDGSNWAGVREFYQAMVRWFAGMATFRKGGWIAMGTFAAGILALEAALVAFLVRLLAGELSAGLAWLAAVGPTLGWAYRRFTREPWWSVALYPLVGLGILAIIASAAHARTRNRVRWRGQTLPIVPDPPPRDVA